MAGPHTCRDLGRCDRCQEVVSVTAGSVRPRCPKCRRKVVALTSVEGAGGRLPNQWPSPVVGCPRCARERAERVGSLCVLCRDFDRGVEVDGSRISSRRDRAMTWWRNRKAIFAKSTQVDLDRPFDSTKSCVDCLARRDASREIRNRGAPVTVGIAIDLDEILQRFHLWPLNPACRLTEAKVPLGMSSPNAPLTVTRPGFVGCLN